MNALSSLFKAANRFALLGWLVLFFLPLLPAQSEAIVLLVVIALLSVLYTYLVIFGKHIEPESEKNRGHFFSLNGVMQLFKSPRMVLAGWVHYLAFDLLVGLYIVNDAAYYNISHWLLLPCLFLTLMFGPAGLLLYLIVRAYISMDISTIGIFQFY